MYSSSSAARLRRHTTMPMVAARRATTARSVMRIGSIEVGFLLHLPTPECNEKM
jgi:Flp pilus assembly protein protease CpaA